MIRLAILGVVLAISTAHADRPTALRYFRSGEKAYRAQNFAAAADSFHLAFLEIPLPEIAFSAAQAYRRQFRVDPKREYVERAVEMYRFYLDKVKRGGRVADAADSLGEMERELEKLGGSRRDTSSSAVTQLGVTVDLTGAATVVTSLTEIAETTIPTVTVPISATLDGTPVEPDKLVDVEPGDHVFRVSAAGYIAVAKKGHAVRGRSDFVEIELQPLPAHLAIETERGARVNVDGRGVGTAPIAALSLSAGRHVITLLRLGREGVAREIHVDPGETFALVQNLSPTRQRRAVTWVAIGGGALALVTGASAIGARIVDGTASSKLDALRMGSQDASLLAGYRTARDRRDALVTATWLAGGATVAMATAAIILYFADRPSAEGLRVTPYVSGSTGGASVMGRF